MRPSTRSTMVVAGCRRRDQTRARLGGSARKRAVASASSASASAGSEPELRPRRSRAARRASSICRYTSRPCLACRVSNSSDASRAWSPRAPPAAEPMRPPLPCGHDPDQGLEEQLFSMVASSSTERMTQKTDRSGITQDLRRTAGNAARTNDNLYHGRPGSRHPVEGLVGTTSKRTWRARWKGEPADRCIRAFRGFGTDTDSPNVLGELA